MHTAITTFENDFIDLIGFISRSRDLDQLIAKLNTIALPDINQDKIIEAYLINRVSHKTYIYI